MALVDILASNMSFTTIWLEENICNTSSHMVSEIFDGRFRDPCSSFFVLQELQCIFTYIAYITFLDTALAALTSIAVPSLVSALSDDVKFIFYLAAGAAFVG